MSNTRILGRHDGKEVIEAVLQSDAAEISIMNYGCAIRDWRVDAAGKAIPCVLGFDSFDPYPDHARSFGIIAGRVANRTARGRFMMGGESFQLDQNDGEHHLHGGSKGLGNRVWDLEMNGTQSVEMTYRSPDGDMGYPGAVYFRVLFSLSGSRLTIEMFGTPDRLTPINLAQHNYYNLDGQGDVLGQVLEIHADHYTPTDEEKITTGSVLPVSGTHYDFRTPVLVGERDHHRVGMDVNLILKDNVPENKPNATLWSEDTGLELKLFSREKGLQIYNAPNIDIPVPGHDGVHYGKFCGLCLEPQAWPDAINKVDWPDILRAPENPYYQKLDLDIAPQL